MSSRFRTHICRLRAAISPLKSNQNLGDPTRIAAHPALAPNSAQAPAKADQAKILQRSTVCGACWLGFRTAQVCGGGRHMGRSSAQQTRGEAGDTHARCVAGSLANDTLSCSSAALRVAFSANDARASAPALVVGLRARRSRHLKPGAACVRAGTEPVPARVRARNRMHRTARPAHLPSQR